MSPSSEYRFSTLNVKAAGSIFRYQNVDYIALNERLIRLHLYGTVVD
jgi:hypothetical protein